MFERPTDELRDQLKAVLEAGVSDDTMKRVKKNVDDICYSIEDDIMYRVKETLADNLSAYVVDMANEAVKAMLAGDEGQLRRYLQCQQGGWTGRDRDHAMIHGRLFESDAITMRRKIVEAHRDLITNERIADLEDIQRSLTDQYNKVHNELEQTRNRLREYQ
jgi:hypothetical protein